VARTVALLAGKDVDLDAVLDTLGPTRGMLYYHLLLGRLHGHSGPSGDATPQARSLSQGP
jgi:hypothetical protein